MICSTCGQTRAITLTHTQRIRGRVVEWVECVRCYLAAEAKPERVATPEPARKRPATAQPFALQLDEVKR